MSEHGEILCRLLKAVSDKLIAAEQTLTELDAVIGDGDCGASLKKGFQMVLEKLPSLNGQSPGGMLKQVGLTITSSVGGVSGALYGTAFLRAGIKIGDKERLSLSEAHEVLQTALQGIKERGEGTKVGDKTMVDALEPAIEVFGKAVSEDEDIVRVLEKSLDAARKGSDSTIPLVAKKGRASYLGERSAGHRDAGSVIICLMFESACDFYRKEVKK